MYSLLSLLSCEVSGALHLAQPGLTAGREAGWQADEIQVNFEIFKIGCRLNIQVFASFNQDTARAVQYYDIYHYRDILLLDIVLISIS